MSLQNHPSVRVWNKLVRDRIPDIIAASNMIATTKHLDADEYKTALKQKLIEEAQEASESTNETLISELADVLEVLRALCTAHHISVDDLERKRIFSAATRGSFDERIFLIETRPT